VAGISISFCRDDPLASPSHLLLPSGARTAYTDNNGVTSLGYFTMMPFMPHGNLELLINAFWGKCVCGSCGWVDGCLASVQYINVFPGGINALPISVCLPSMLPLQLRAASSAPLRIPASSWR
jgi:hypothetical protein